MVISAKVDYFPLTPSYFVATSLFSNSQALSKTFFLASDFQANFIKAWESIGGLLQHYKEPITVLNSTFSLIGSSHPTVWSAIHNPANYLFIPPQHRREFLQATANTGWLVIEKNSPLRYI